MAPRAPVAPQQDLTGLYNFLNMSLAPSIQPMPFDQQFYTAQPVSRDQTMPVPKEVNWQPEQIDLQGIGGMLPDFYKKVAPGGPADPDMRFDTMPVPSDLPAEELIDSPYYTGPDYGPGKRMMYSAVAPQRGMRYVYDQKGGRHSIPIEGYEGPIGNPIARLQPSGPEARIGIPQPTYNAPLSRDELMAGFEEWKRNNPDKLGGGGLQALIPTTLPG